MKQPALKATHFEGEDVIATSGRVAISSVFNSTATEMFHSFFTPDGEDKDNPNTSWAAPDFDETTPLGIDQDTFLGVDPNGIYNVDEGLGKGVMNSIIHSLYNTYGSEDMKLDGDMPAKLYNNIKNAKFLVYDTDYDSQGREYLWLDKNGDGVYSGSDEDLTLSDLIRSTTGTAGAVKVTKEMKDVYDNKSNGIKTTIASRINAIISLNGVTEPEELDLLESEKAFLNDWLYVNVTEDNRNSYGELATLEGENLTKITFDPIANQYVLHYGDGPEAPTQPIDPTFFLDPDITEGRSDTLELQGKQITKLSSIFNDKVWGVYYDNEGKNIHFRVDDNYIRTNDPNTGEPTEIKLNGSDTPGN